MQPDNQDCDVVVVGAGPGGSACATALAQRGIRTLVLEKKRFPRDKTCGDGLGSRIPSALAELGIDPAICDRFQSIRGLLLTSPSGIDFHGAFTPDVGRDGVVYVAPRLELDQLLRSHAEACGAEIREGIEVTGLLTSGADVEGVAYRTTQGGHHSVRARVVVGADGEHSVVRRDLGIELPKARRAFAVRAYYEGIEGLQEEIELHYDRRFFPAYFWVFPVGEGRANVGCGAFDFWSGKQRINLPQAMQQFIAEHPAARTRFRNARRVSPVRGWPLSMGNLARRCQAGRALLVGDAAAFINPLTGEGIHNAMQSGLIAAEVIAGALSKGHHRLDEYQRRWQTCFREEFRYSYLIRVALGRFPWLLDRIARKARSDETVATTMACAITGAISPKQLLRPGFLARLL
jgi:geranylgeranyl reductase family protein